MHMRRTANKLFGTDYRWSILPVGKHQMTFVTMGAMMGGNIRVGLEDRLHVAKSELAKSNADQVAKVWWWWIVEYLSLEVATPAEARVMLGLKTRLLTPARCARSHLHRAGNAGVLSRHSCPATPDFSQVASL